MRRSKTGSGRKAYKHAEEISKRMGNAVRIDLVRGVTTYKRSVNAKTMEKAIATGNYRKVMGTLKFSDLGDAWAPAFEGVRRAAKLSSDNAVRSISEALPDKYRYDINNPRIDNYIATRTGNLITTSEDGMLEAVRASVRRSFTDGLTNTAAAEEITSSIGLNAPQARALANYRAGLAASDTLSDAAQKAAGDDYASRLLDQRAMMIARTEIRFADNEAQIDVYKAADADGLLPPNSKKVWVVDGAPCEVCEPMDGVAVGLDDPWTITMPGGKRRQVWNPTDSHPQCYCIVSIEMGAEEI